MEIKCGYEFHDSSVPRIAATLEAITRQLTKEHERAVMAVTKPEGSTEGGHNG